jgi:uncharacterized protein
MSTEFLIYFIILALFAEVIGTVGGFGSSLFFIPIASLFLDFHSVLGVTAVFHVVSNITKIYFFRQGFDKKLILSLGIPAVLFVIIGAFCSKYVNSKHLELSFAIFMIITSMAFFFSNKIAIQATTKNSIIGGVLSGFIAGLIGTGGAIRGLTLTAFSLSKDVFIATSAIIDLGIDASRSVVYYYNGFVHYDDLYLIPILLVVSVVGTYLGKLILAKLSEIEFKRIVVVLIFVMGILALFKAFQ